MRAIDRPAAVLTRLAGAGRPMNADADALVAHGFVEQEYLARGGASRYRLPDPLGDAVRVDGPHPFATRALVRRPAEPGRFNGAVVVEWLNVSTGQDLDFVFGATRDLLLRQGYAWVGVSAQRGGIQRLRSWNPERYASLTVSAPETDPLTDAALDPAHEATGAVGGDVLCWDIFSQVLSAVRAQAADLFGVPSVACVIAAGESQSAFRLSRYYNSLQSLHQACEGFLLYDRGGPMPLRSDVSAKVLSVGTEFMSAYLGAPSPADGEHQRWWELAGSAHVSLDEVASYIDPQVRRDASMPIDDKPAGLTDVLRAAHPGAELPLWSRVPNADLTKAALHALHRWLTVGTPPPSAPRLTVGGDGRLHRDADARVVGGIRYAAYEVPSADNVGATETGCPVAGHHRDFGPAEMRRRHGDAAQYLARVQATVHGNVEGGFLLPEDAERVIAEARAAARRFEDRG
jgi:hypothetical protein